MDLNQLLYHHQMALMAVSQAKRDGYLLPSFDLPRYYAKRINEYRERRGLVDGFIAVADPAPAGLGLDPPPSGPSTDYPVFVGDTLIAELLVNEALAMTEEERASVALDDIAGRLAEVQEDIWIIGRDIYRALGLDEHKLRALVAKLPSVSEAYHSAAQPRHFLSQTEDGIVHSYEEQFRVGPFRYSNIDDARAALLRQRIVAGLAGEQDNDG